MAEKKKVMFAGAAKKAAPKPKMTEVIIHDTKVSVDAIPAKPERTAKVVFENEYCRVVEDYDKVEECVFYILTDKSLPDEAQRFATMEELEKSANRRRLK